MKKSLISTLMLLLFSMSLSLYAQDRQNPDREQWRRDMQQLKVDFMAKELKLSEAQKAEFGPLLTSMDDEIEAVATTLRKTEKNLEKKGDAATDAEYRTAAEAMFEQRAKESAIEKSYYTKFSKILTPKQLFKFKQAERKFMMKLMEKRPKGDEKRQPGKPRTPRP